MIDARMKIRHLQCFMEVARLGHVGRAADQLAVTQPAVSKTLRELEQFLNVRLFTRGPKGLALTPLGEAFQHHAATGVLALQQAIASVAPGRLRGDANIRVGALPTVAVRIMPDAVRELTAQCRDAAVHLVTGPNRILLERLKGRELDVVVGRLADPDQMVGLAFEQLYLERMAVVVKPGHPLLAELPFEPRRLTEFEVLMPSREDITRPIVDRLLLASGIGAIERRIETVSSDFSRAYLKRTDAVWIISYGVAALDIAAGDLVELPLDVSATLGPVGMTTRADDRPAPIVDQFMKVTRTLAERLRGDGGHRLQ
jgi:LysR family transcriptional regulator, pca operon transcriptional activator